jgi:hypothetical protein
MSDINNNTKNNIKVYSDINNNINEIWKYLNRNINNGDIDSHIFSIIKRNDDNLNLISEILKIKLLEKDYSSLSVEFITLANSFFSH